MMYQSSGWIKSIALILAVSLFFALPVFAGFADDLARDLGPKTATLVAPAPSAGEWLIDLDASAGVQAGDLFAVIVKGAPIVHPTTKQTIGNLETVKAVLRVTKVKSGYSYVAPIGAADLKAGDEARRFSALPATFWDYTGEGTSVLATLQGALPDLQWQSYAAAQAIRPEPPRPVAGMEPGLLFVLNDKGLAVTDHAQQPLRFYRPEVVSGKVYAAQSAAAPLAAPAGASIVTPGSPAAAPHPGAIPGGSSPGLFSGVTKVFGGGSSTPLGPGGVLAGSGSASRGGLIMSQMDSREGVWYGPRLAGQPVGVEVGDLTGDSKNEIALCFKDRLVVARVADGNFESLAEYEFDRSGNALNLNGLDLDGDGRMELYVTMSQLKEVKSLAFEMQAGKLVQTVKPVSYFVRKIKVGTEDYALWGQELNTDLLNINQELAGPIFQVSRSGDTLQRGAAVNLPGEVTLYGMQPFEHGGRSLVARINPNDKLQVLELAGGILWESSDYFGGSETSFERFDGMQGATTRYAFIQPRLEAGPDGTVLVPVNEGSRTFSAFRTFNASHLKAVTYDGYSLVERWRTKPQGGYLGDFRMADADNDGADEIVMLVMFSRGGLMAGTGNSALLIYEMQ